MTGERFQAEVLVVDKLRSIDRARIFLLLLLEPFYKINHRKYEFMASVLDLVLGIREAKVTPLH